MTFEDVKVIGLGTIGLLVLFLTVQAVFVSRLDLWAIARRYVTVRLIEPVRDDDQTSSAGGLSGSGDPVRWQQNHQEPDEPGDIEPAREPSLRQLAKDDLIVLLAIQRNDDGGYRWSANDITKFVGGTAAPIKQTIAAVRGEKPKPAQGAPLKRPAGGW